MQFTDLIANPATWMASAGSIDPIVVSSRIRLARNLSGHPFPGWAKKETRQATFQEIVAATSTLPELEAGFSEELSTLSSLEKQVLVERHLMSREQAARSTGCGLAVNPTQSLSIMINEEDHLRLQSVKQGLDLKGAFELINSVDDLLAQKLDYAYDVELGYLTACPSNLGTGMRASAMLHLPGLTLSEQIESVLKAVAKLGLAIRGFYGEGTQSLGNFFQISNQSTLGESEAAIIERIDRVVAQIVVSEKNARLKLLSESKDMLFDRVARAYAVLQHCHIISSKEALNLLSLLRLGMEIGFLPIENTETCDLLLMKIQPAHLQLHAQRKVAPEQRDLIRAEIIRTHLKSLTPPSQTLSPIVESRDASNNNRPQ